MNTATRQERWSGYALLTVMAIAVVIPFLSVFLASLQPAGTPVVDLTWPERWSWDNYEQAWSVAGFSDLIQHSLTIAVGVVPASLVLAALAGYALGTMKLPGGNAVAAFFIAGLTIPVELIVVPLYFDLRGLGLTNSYLGVILVEIALFMPFSVFWMRTHFQSTPPSLVEAARIDGASSATILLRILLPLARPSLMTLGLLVFMWSWNQFLLVLVLIQDTTKHTAPAGLGFFVGQNSTDIPSTYFVDKNDLTTAVMMRFAQTTLIPNMAAALSSNLHGLRADPRGHPGLRRDRGRRARALPLRDGQQLRRARTRSSPTPSEIIARMLAVMLRRQMVDVGMDTGGVEPWAYHIGRRRAAGDALVDVAPADELADELIDYLTMLSWNALCGIVEVGGSLAAVSGNAAHPSPVLAATVAQREYERTSREFSTIALPRPGGDKVADIDTSAQRPASTGDEVPTTPRPLAGRSGS